MTISSRTRHYTAMPTLRAIGMVVQHSAFVIGGAWLTASRRDRGRRPLLQVRLFAFTAR